MNRRSWLLMALLAALWGASYLFIKVALEDGVPPVFLVFARIALGAAVLVPIAARAGALQATRGWTGPIVFMAIVQVVVPFLLITYGERHIASSLTGILVSAAPIFTALIAVRYDDEERPHGVAIAGVAMGIVGVVLLFGVDLSGDSAAIAGGLMVLLASAGYAVGSLYLKHRLQGVPAVGIAAATMLTGTLVLAPLALFELPPHALEPKTVGALVALGAGGTGIAFAIYYTLIAEIGRARVARRVHRAGVRGRLRRDAAERGDHRGGDPRPAADPRRLVGRRGGAAAGAGEGAGGDAARTAARARAGVRRAHPVAVGRVAGVVVFAVAATRSWVVGWSCRGSGGIRGCGDTIVGGRWRSARSGVVGRGEQGSVREGVQSGRGAIAA